MLASLMSSIFPEAFSDPGDTTIASPPFGSQIITVGNRYFGLRPLVLSCTFCVRVEGGGGGSPGAKPSFPAVACLLSSSW